MNRWHSKTSNANALRHSSLEVREKTWELLLQNSKQKMTKPKQKQKQTKNKKLISELMIDLFLFAIFM